MKYVVPIAALFVVSCTAVVDESSKPAEPGGPAQQAGVPAPANPDAPAPLEPLKVPFAVRAGEPELLSFDIRVRRIASAVGVSTDNAMFAEMQGANIKLGDHDHANGVLPDNLWVAHRISGWLDALRPVCNSAEMKAAYPALPADLPKLIRNAWGRAASPEDLADFSGSLTPAHDAYAYESTCMVVFSAAEFVYR